MSANQLDQAVRAIVRDEMNRPPPRAASEKLAWGSLLFLFILAIDISAIIWALADLFEHPVIKLVVQSMPALVGVALAAYKEHLQTVVWRVANRLWFRIAVSFGLVLIVYPIMRTYSVPLKITSPNIEVLIDDKKVNARRDRAGVVRVPVSGLHEHKLTVSGYDGEDKVRKDTYQFHATDLWRSFLRPTAAFEVGLLVPLTVQIADTTIRSVVVAGKFPELFLRGAPEPFEEITRLATGDHQVSIKARDGVDAQELALPPGQFSVRYVGSKCTSQPDTVTLVDRKPKNLSLAECK